MMFDFDGDVAETEGPAAAAAGAGRMEMAGEGDRARASRRPPGQPRPPSPDPVAKANEAVADEGDYGHPPGEEELALEQDPVTALLPVLKDISRQFSEYTVAMETAVRDLAETENDLQAELQHMLHRSRQVLSAHGQMRQRFTARLDGVSRCLLAQAASQE